MRVARVLREARLGAGLSQAELARRARTSQSAVARYERGVSTPSLATLERLLRACGRPLRLTIPRLTRSPRGTAGPRGRSARLVRRNRDRLLAAARRNGVTDIRLFGSVARGDDSPTSDIDLLVTLGSDRTLLDLVAFQQDAGDLLGVPVDVAIPEILKERVRERVLAEAVPL